ncbi:MAG: 30S ribosomal protein S6 [Candidatus Yanofskybacteria bacterium]|nr:30S ribosomal protein S6 [Candidatus Yanofskybacteria bacterium]
MRQGIISPSAYGNPGAKLQYCMPDIKNNYELGYHLNQNIEEARVSQLREELEKLLTNNGAVVVFSKEPEKTRLSYEIKHERASYFGFIQFSLENKEALAAIDEQLRLNNSLLRYIVLIVEPVKAKKGKPRSLMGQGEHKVKKPEQVTTEEERKEIEKKLEDIIEGL